MTYRIETEADTRFERIEPALGAAGWGTVNGSRIDREVTISKGRIQTGGERSDGLIADIVLSYKGRQLAILEAKRASRSHRDGVEQAKRYAKRLCTHFAYATNGLRWYEVNMLTAEEREINLPFPTPEELWKRIFSDENDWRDRFGDIDFQAEGGRWEPRYYQHIAITAALEAIANGRRRVLLTLATGTGKTSIAFQIAWKLFQSRWNLSGKPTRRPRILFLADRNILADQAFNSFSAFPNDSIVRIRPQDIHQWGRAPRNASVYFTIFQTFLTDQKEKKVYTSYSRDFFDFIVVDECHRGGANDESTWRCILEYFEPAVQLGLTATPKRDQNTNTYVYFGNPVYTYALRDGIEDGYLTPFKVRQMASTIDNYVYNRNDTVLAGEVAEGDEFNEDEINRTIHIEDRELSRVKEFMRQMNQMEKTIVFCATQDHAALVRDLINQVKDSSNVNYCCRVTADEGALGEQHLRSFQDNERTIPTILTTSYKLSTGVDARNIRNIVLMRPIRSMIEFKQIIGRGTRTYEGKDFFTIWDFVKAHENFNDPEWDGEPDDPSPPRSRVVSGSNNSDTGEKEEESDDDGKRDALEVVEIKLGDETVRSIQYIASTTYWDSDGKPISAAELLTRLFGDLSNIVADEDHLRQVWSDPDTRKSFFEQLSEYGYDLGRLKDIQRLIDAPDSDLFDVLRHVRFGLERKTRQQRVDNFRQHGMPDINNEMRELLLGILEEYESQGESELAGDKLSAHLTNRYGSVSESRKSLGEPRGVRDAYKRMQTTLYAN